MYKAILADLTVIAKIWEWRKIHFMKDGSIMLFAFLPQTPSFPASSFLFYSSFKLRDKKYNLSDFALLQCKIPFTNVLNRFILMTNV